MNLKQFLTFVIAFCLTSLSAFAQSGENSNPYAIFGGNPYIAGEPTDSESVKVFVVENIDEGSPVARLEHNTETGVVILFDADGNVIGRKQLVKGERAWPTIDPKAEKYYGTSPYVFSGNNPIRYIDPNGMWYDDYYSRLNGKYLGSDGAATNNMRLINDDTFNHLSRHLNDPFMNRDLAVASLQGASDIISVDEGQIQSSLQSVADNSRSSGVEHSIIIVLDRATATISAVEGPEGENRFAPISYHPGPVTGVSFYERAGGPIIIGQAHGHPANSDPNLTTQKTMSDDYDVNVATNMQIPVYGIDAMDGKQGSPANIHMVYPNGIIRNNIGNTQTIGIGRQAMTIWGFSNKPR